MTFERSLTPVDAIALPILFIFSDASNEAFVLVPTSDGEPRAMSTTHEEWIRFFQEMGDLNHVTFERSLTPVDAIALPILFIFSDASNEAFVLVPTSDGEPRAMSTTHDS